MRNSQLASAWSAIKSKTAHIVKLLGVLGLGCVFWLSPQLTRGDDIPPSPPAEEAPPPATIEMRSPDQEPSQQGVAPPAASASPAPGTEELPDIQARTYNVSVDRRSNSNRVYMLTDTDDAKPRPGRILLLRKPNSPTDSSNQIMAFRILRTYPEKKQFAAKVVRKYGDLQNLPDRSSYAAIEKISDFYPPPPTPQDKADLKELESKNPPAAPAPKAAPSPQTKAAPSAPQAQQAPAHAEGYDPELDAGTSPPPPAEVENQPDDNHLGLTVEEIQPLETRRSWLSAELGFFQNLNIDPSTFVNNAPVSGYYAGGGARYGFSIWRQILLRKARVQDSITPEIGVFVYKILGSNNDTYTLLPLLGTIRYNILLGDTLALFIYGGVMQNIVVAATQPTTLPDGKTPITTALTTTIPAFGAGILLRLGPSWNIRLDAGFDSFATGVVLKF